MDVITEGLAAAVESNAFPLCVRHGAKRAIGVLNDYYSKTDTSHAARFSMSELCIQTLHAFSNDKQ